MIYFETKYFGATNCNGSKIGVKRSEDSRFKMFSYDYEASDSHDSAFNAYILKFEPQFKDNEFIKAGGNVGNVYVFMPKNEDDYNIVTIKEKK